MNELIDSGDSPLDLGFLEGLWVQGDPVKEDKADEQEIQKRSWPITDTQLLSILVNLDGVIPYKKTARTLSFETVCSLKQMLHKAH